MVIRLILICLYSFSSTEVFIQQELTGKVISVADGDTFTVLAEGNKQVKVRLHGIDCPEKGQDYGEAAKKYLQSLLLLDNENVRVMVMSKDRYKRTIGIAYIGHVNINERMLEAGLAWHYNRYDNNSKWALKEEAARKYRLKLWSMPNPIAPWEWRSRKK